MPTTCHCSALPGPEPPRYKWASRSSRTWRYARNHGALQWVSIGNPLVSDSLTFVDDHDDESQDLIPTSDMVTMWLPGGRRSPEFSASSARRRGWRAWRGNRCRRQLACGFGRSPALMVLGSRSTCCPLQASSRPLPACVARRTTRSVTKRTPEYFSCLLRPMPTATTCRWPTTETPRHRVLLPGGPTLGCTRLVIFATPKRFHHCRPQRRRYLPTAGEPLRSAMPRA